MKFNGNFNHLGKIDNNIFNIIKNQLFDKSNDEHWKADSKFRKNIFLTHNIVDCYCIKYEYALINEGMLPGDINYKADRTSEWQDVIPTLLNFISDYYGYKVKLAGLLAAKLPAGASIPEHMDDGSYLHSVHRIHLPIVTSGAVEFRVDCETISMKVGYLYEINNCIPHEVINNDKTINRTHMIIDVLKE